MGTTTNWGWPTPDEGDAVDDLNGLLTAILTAIDASLPIKKFTSLAQLNTMTGSANPAGSVAVLTSSNDGCTAGALFTRVGSVWRLVSGASITNLAEFSGLVASLANVQVMPGASFRAEGDGTSRIWTSTEGSNTVIEDTLFNPISYISGTRAPTSFRSLHYAKDPTGVQLLGGVVKTSGTFAANAVIAQLPTAARPSQTQYFLVPGAGSTLAKIGVESDGQVRVLARISGASAWYDLTTVHVVN